MCWCIPLKNIGKCVLTERFSKKRSAKKGSKFMKEEAKRWIDFAGEDLLVAELTLKEGINNQVCFHSQQCVEKVLKGFIIFKGKIHPQSHKLADILSKIPKSPFDDLRDEILLLDRFYISTRYPDALP